MLLYVSGVGWCCQPRCGVVPRFEVLLLMLCVMLLEELFDGVRLSVERCGFCRNIGLIYRCKLLGMLASWLCPFQT